ncbi:hypothetical protein B0H16DRAFT_1480562 [Mycena metata]|uniref:Uncharacterized protein n=1 Tax=Mycena metata TaxID=1033252 RepID=A0AAD7H3R3_9AGAR|nr:hypothetical protein B0H16DRAFT_1480562 [Mycena metata]
MEHLDEVQKHWPSDQGEQKRPVSTTVERVNALTQFATPSSTTHRSFAHGETVCRGARHYNRPAKASGSLLTLNDLDLITPAPEEDIMVMLISYGFHATDSKSPRSMQGTCTTQQDSTLASPGSIYLTKLLSNHHVVAWRAFLWKPGALSWRVLQKHRPETRTTGSFKGDTFELKPYLHLLAHFTDHMDIYYNAV